MAVMRRGANVELTREIPGLAGLVLGVAWDAGSETALADNLVLATILCGADSRALSEAHFVFFNQLASPALAVRHLDEVLGDDREQMEIDLTGVPAEVARIVAVLYVNDGPAHRRTLGQLRSCAIRVLNLAGNAELVRSEDFAKSLSSETAIALGEVYRHGAGWKFKVIGDGYSQGVAGVLADYGLSA
ncbi:MAG: TerD family protein [Trebonia sp.]